MTGRPGWPLCPPNPVLLSLLPWCAAVALRPQTVETLQQSHPGVPAVYRNNFTSKVHLNILWE